MSSRCEDCGCILEGGICSNCHEELFIQTYQAEDAPSGFSKEFTDKAAEQSAEIERRKKYEI